MTSTSPDPRDWTYFVETNGPTGSEFRRVPSAAVIHIRYSVDPRSPWRGVAPLGWAKEAAELSASVDQSLRAELNEVVAHLIGIEPSSPSPDPSPAEIQAIQEALGARRFQSLYPRSRRVPESVETPTAAFGIPSFLTRKTSVSRIGPSIPASSVGLKTEASEAVFTALGIPLPLVSGAEGTAAREAWRRFASGCLEPLGRLAATELSDKLDAEIGISFERLFAADLSGRARAFQSLVGGGMSPKKAARLAGLMGAED